MPAEAIEALQEIREQARRRLSSSTSGVTEGPIGLDATRVLVDALHDWIAAANQAADIGSEMAALVQGSVLQSAFPVFLQWRHGHLDRAADVLFHIWGEHVRGLSTVDWPISTPTPLLEPSTSTPDDSELLSLFNAAVGQRLREAEGAAEARRILRRLVATLELSFDEVGRMFGVSGETVRRWERGLASVPPARSAALTTAEAALDQLLTLFRPERLPVAVRRPDALFEGERALDWILRCRIQEVANRYDRALRYQA